MFCKNSLKKYVHCTVLGIDHILDITIFIRMHLWRNKVKHIFNSEITKLLFKAWKYQKRNPDRDIQKRLEWISLLLDQSEVVKQFAPLFILDTLPSASPYFYHQCLTMSLYKITVLYMRIEKMTTEKKKFRKCMKIKEQ